MSMGLQNLYSTKAEAIGAVKRWRASGFSAKVKPSGKYFAVYTSDLDSRRKIIKSRARAKARRTR